MMNEQERDATYLIYALTELRRRFDAVAPSQTVKLKELFPQVATYRVRDFDVFMRVSRALHGKDGVRMCQLSDKLRVPPNTATRMVDWLVASGYASRSPDPADRRAVQVSLTASGCELYESLGQSATQTVGRMMNKLTVEERTMLVLLLRKALRKFNQELQ